MDLSTIHSCLPFPLPLLLSTLSLGLPLASHLYFLHFSLVCHLLGFIAFLRRLNSFFGHGRSVITLHNKENSKDYKDVDDEVEEVVVSRSLTSTLYY